MKTKIEIYNINGSDELKVWARLDGSLCTVMASLDDVEAMVGETKARNLRHSKTIFYLPTQTVKSFFNSHEFKL